MTQASVPAPSVKLTSFACPICGAHATQTWYQTRLEICGDKHPIPAIFSLEEVENYELKIKKLEGQERVTAEEMVRYFRRTLTAEPFLGNATEGPYRPPNLENVFVSRCYTCKKVSIWLRDQLLYPSTMTGPAPNPDLSEDVLRDYREARMILDKSPRGASALLRLAIEKICIELEAEGKDINQRIAFLVSKGLPETVQQALDTVRVIGNEAVHPGQLDLRDDREIASKLFDLVNFIAVERITRPKQIKILYDMIPEEKRKAIEDRNAKAVGKLE